MSSRWRFESILFLIVCICLYAIASPTSQGEPILKADKAKLDCSNEPLKGNVAYKPLQGGIALSCTMPPTPPSLHKGAVFKKANIPKTPKITDWYLIPSWLAGEWHRETVTELFPIEIIGTLFGLDKTYIERADHLWGHQIDRLGGIWHHRNEPYTQIVEHRDSTFIKTITLQEPVCISDSKVIMHYKDLTVQFGKSNHTILTTYQHEQISEISRQGDLLLEDIKDKDFDENGHCFREGHTKTTYTMIKPFHPTTSDKKTKLNLEEDFKLYLKSHRSLDRLPENAPKSKKESSLHMSIRCQFEEKL